MDRYIFKYSELAEGVYGVSPVSEPANEQMAILLNKDVEIKLSSIENEKRLMTGVVLIPNQVITRLNKQTGQEYEIQFDAEGIRLLSQDFLKNGNQGNAWENHQPDKKLNGFNYVESWIIEDENNDKANALGLSNLVKGSWVLSAYVENDEIWNKLKSGELKGFSIDSILSFEKIEMAMENNNNKIKKEEKMSLLKKLITLFTEEKVDTKLATVDTNEYGTLTYDSLEMGSIVYDANMLPAAAVEFEVDGYTYETDDNGAIISIEQVNVNDPADSMDTNPADNVPTNMGDVTLEEGVVNSESYSVGETLTLDKGDGNGPMPYANADIEVEGKHIMTDENGVITVADEIVMASKEDNSVINEQKLAIENFTKQLEIVLNENKELKEKIANLEAKTIELSKEPATTKLKSNETSVDFKSMTDLERYRYNKARFNQ